MAPNHKLQVETELSSGEKFYVTMKNNFIHLPKYLPDIYKSVQVLQGDGKNIGTVRLWKNAMGGNIVEFKRKLEVVDDEIRLIIFKVIGGDVMKLYKSLKFSFNANPRKDDECLMKWTVEFEKANEEVHVPNMFLDLTTITNKEVARIVSIQICFKCSIHKIISA